MSDIKFSTVIGIFGNASDRFCTSGYKTNKSIDEMFKDASTIKDIKGIELVATWNINENNINQIKKLKDNYGFEISTIVVDLFTQTRWGKGTLSLNDKKIRQESINEIKKYMDIAPELNCSLLDIWLGQDGYDYSFQSNYIDSWNLIMDGLKECADYRKDIRLGIEYKIKEPRTHCHINTIGTVLMVINKLNKDNIGVIIDVGHALFAYENVAESICLCKMFGDKLYHLHFNDNYRMWDDDMMVGSIHIQEYLELLYWLKRNEYNGWYSLDVFPYREDGIGAAKESIEWLKFLINAINKVSDAEINEALNEKDAVKSSRLIRKMLTS